MNNLDKLCDVIVKNDFKIIFGISGSGTSYQLISKLLSKGLMYYNVSNESAAAIACGTYNYFNRKESKKALCISIKGPGFSNLLSGMSACFYEKYDCYSISEEYNDDVEKEKFHKKIDQLHLVKPISIELCSLKYPNDFNSFFKHNENLNGVRHFFLANKELSKKSIEINSNNSDVFDAGFFHRIDKSTKPLLIVGSSVNQFLDNSKISLLDLPILTTVKAKGFIDENNDNSYGIYTGVDGDYLAANDLINQSDLIIAIGVINEELLSIKHNNKFIKLNFLNTVDSELINVTILNKIISGLKIKENWFFKSRQKYLNKISLYINKQDWMPANIFNELNRIERTFSLVIDTGFFCTVGEVIFKATETKRFIGSTNGRNMGISIPQSVGVSMGGMPSICCVGDGGIKYHMGELISMVKLNLPILIIYFSDGCFGSISAYIGDHKFEEDVLIPSQTSWVNLFNSIGFKSYLIDSNHDLKLKLSDWNFNSPAFFHCNFNSEHYKEITKNLRE